MYDPTRKILKTILKNGELVEPYEDDVETRSIWTTEDIALTLINEQEAEVELVEPLKEQEIEDIQIVQEIIDAYELVSDDVVNEYEQKIEVDKICK